MSALRLNVRRIGDGLQRLLVRALIQFVRFYQVTISPLLGSHCRYVPSCSEYLIQAVMKYGVIRGVSKGLGRILRCHPWRQGGYDPP